MLRAAVARANSVRRSNTTDEFLPRLHSTSQIPLALIQLVALFFLYCPSVLTPGLPNANKKRLNTGLGAVLKRTSQPLPLLMFPPTSFSRKEQEKKREKNTHTRFIASGCVTITQVCDVINPRVVPPSSRVDGIISARTHL